MSLEKMCNFYGKTRQGYYKNQKELPNKKETVLKDICSLVLKVKTVLPNSGVRKVYKLIKADLDAQSLKVGRDALFDIVRDMGLLLKRRHSGKKTTNSNHPYKRYSNLVKELEVTRPNQVFVSDITYIACESKSLYLSLITDMYSRRIVGYELSESLTANGPIKAIKMALKGVKNPDALIHHSDRGVQYCCNDYIAILQKAGVKVSMTEEQHVYENAMAERVNGILKWEFGLNSKFKTKEEAYRVLNEAIHLYNSYRPHLSLNYKTPDKIYFNEI